MATTYTKLSSGSWGLRGPAELLKPGMLVTVTKKSGDEKREHVGRIVWEGKDRNTGDLIAIAEISRGAGSPDSPARKTSLGRGKCSRCGCTDTSCVRNGRCTGGPSFNPCFDCM